MTLANKFLRGWFVTSLLVLFSAVAVAKFSYTPDYLGVISEDGVALLTGTTGDNDMSMLVDQSDESVGWVIDESADGLLMAEGGTEGLRVGTNRFRQILTVTDVDAQNNTLDVAELVTGITVHTSVTGGGTVTTDTAALIIAGASSVGILDTDNECYQHYYINDGTQTLTFAGGTGVTVSDTGNTILTNEAAILLFCRTSSSAITMHIVTS